jgi:hypothetical protein
VEGIGEQLIRHARTDLVAGAKESAEPGFRCPSACGCCE